MPPGWQARTGFHRSFGKVRLRILRSQSKIRGTLRTNERGVDDGKGEQRRAKARGLGAVCCDGIRDHQGVGGGHGAPRLDREARSG